MSVVHPPPSGGGDQAERWAERWIAETQASLPEAPRHERPAAVARLSTVLLACARDEEADAVLMAARRDAVRAGEPVELARIEIALGAAALARDDDASARSRLALAREAHAPLPASVACHAWLVDARLARLAGDTVPPAPPDALSELEGPAGLVDPDERIELTAEMALERAQVARERGSLSVAHVELAKAHEIVELSGSQRLVAAFEVEAGCYAADAGDPDHARERFRAAIDRFREAGLRRGEGRAMIRFAEFIATRAERLADESAAVWLGRAQQVLGPAATWRDRLAIRTGFRAFGRRVFDRVMTEGTVTRIEAFERARGSLVNALANVAHATDRALTDLEVGVDRGEDVAALERGIGEVRTAARDQAALATQAVGQLDESMRDLVEIIGAALFERDRLRILLNVLSEIDSASDEASLPPIVASLAAQLLDADRVVVAVERNGQLVPLAEAGEGATAGTTDEWRTYGEEATKQPAQRPSDPLRLSPRSGEALCGPRITVPIRGREATGVLYADKVRRAGQFREQDLAIAHLLAEYVALAFGRLRAREQERFALHQLAVTLDTIRDGVIACDGQGVVASMNAAAARMLHVSPDEALGAQLEAIPQLASLSSMLSVTQRLDGAVVRLAHGSFVVTARPISATDDADRGFVATLVELDRAQKIAQRLSATRARYGFHDVVGRSPSLQSAIALGAARRHHRRQRPHHRRERHRQGGPRAGHPHRRPARQRALRRRQLRRRPARAPRGGALRLREGRLHRRARRGQPRASFELAAGGTILLDEIGDMPLDMQAKLLRVLQERVVTRLGGRSEVPVHARVVATTHRDLAQLVDEGKFRMDLFYRLRVLAIEMPPLRDRPDDIPLLAQLFLAALRRAAAQARARARAPRARRARALRLARQRARAGERDGGRGEPRAARHRRPRAPRDAPRRPLPHERRGDDRRVARHLDVARGGAARSCRSPRWRSAPSSTPSSGARGASSKAAEALGVSKVTIYAKLRAWGMHPRDRNEETGEGPTSARWSYRIHPRRRGLDGGPAVERHRARGDECPAAQRGRPLVRRVAHRVAQAGARQVLTSSILDRADAARRAPRPDPAVRGADRRRPRRARGAPRREVLQGGRDRLRAGRQRLVDVHRAVGRRADLPPDRGEGQPPRRPQGPAHGRVLRRALALRRQAALGERARAGRHGAPRADARGARRAPRALEDRGDDHPRPRWPSACARRTRCSAQRAAKDVVKEIEENLTWGQRLADKVAELNGSWAFILLLIGLTFAWAIVNIPAIAVHVGLISKDETGKVMGFDPYPYILYNLVLAILVALQGPLIVMSQNRQTLKDRAQAETDFRVNLKNEVGIEKMLAELGAMRAETNKRLEVLERGMRRGARAGRDPGEDAGRAARRGVERGEPPGRQGRKGLRRGRLAGRGES